MLERQMVLTVFEKMIWLPVTGSCGMRPLVARGWQLRPPGWSLFSTARVRVICLLLGLNSLDESLRNDLTSSLLKVFELLCIICANFVVVSDG